MSQEFFISSKILVRPIINKGLGVVAKENIREGEIVECSPAFVIEAPENLDTDWGNLFEAMLKVLFRDRYYEWGQKGGVVLGYGSLYNHSDNSNVSLDRRLEEKKAIYTAKRDIRAGEELTINYACPLWFKTY